CPPELEKVIQKACAKKVQDRYPTPLALREAIEAAVGALPSNDELAAWLKELFPGSDEARAATGRTCARGGPCSARSACEAGPQGARAGHYDHLSAASREGAHRPAGALGVDRHGARRRWRRLVVPHQGRGAAARHTRGPRGARRR